MNQIIHAAVRRDVARMEQALREMPDGDAERAGQLQRAWRHLVKELTHHHEAEDSLVWPFLQSRGFDLELLGSMEAEHADLKVALDDGSRAIDAVVADPTAERARVAAEVVSGGSAVICGHLDHEERDVEPLFAGLEDDPHWKATARKLRPASMFEAADSLAWMQDGASERERRALRQTIPAPVVGLLTTVFARRYRRDVAPTWRVAR